VFRTWVPPQARPTSHVGAFSAVFPVALAAPLADRHDANRLAAAHGTLLGLRVERDPVDRAGLVLGERLPRHRERVPDGPVGEPL